MRAAHIRMWERSGAARVLQVVYGCKCCRTVWDDADAVWRQRGAQHCIFLACVAHADSSVHVAQHAFQQLGEQEVGHVR